MRHPFVVHVAQLRRAIGTRWRERRQGPIDGLDVRAARPRRRRCRWPMSCSRSVLGGVSVTGTVTRPVGGGLPALPGAGLGDAATWPCASSTPTRATARETYPLVGDELDLEPLVRDAILLELPQAPLCREDCQGLCPIVRGQSQRGALWVRGTARSPLGALDVLRCPRARSRASPRADGGARAPTPCPRPPGRRGGSSG